MESFLPMLQTEIEVTQIIPLFMTGATTSGWTFYEAIWDNVIIMTSTDYIVEACKNRGGQRCFTVGD